MEINNILKNLKILSTRFKYDISYQDIGKSFLIMYKNIDKENVSLSNELVDFLSKSKITFGTSNVKHYYLKNQNSWKEYNNNLQIEIILNNKLNKKTGRNIVKCVILDLEKGLAFE